MIDSSVLKGEIDDLLAVNMDQDCAPLLEQGARSGDLDCALLMKDGYLHGLYGLKANRNQAITWLKKSAILGDPASMYHLGVVEKALDHPGEAYAWMMRAWNNDVKEAAIQIALMQAAGAGVPQNLEKARDWALRAVESGAASLQDDAPQNILNLYARHCLDQGKRAQAKTVWQQMQSAEGWKQLAQAFPEEKRHWLQLAANAEDAQAELLLGLELWQQENWKAGTNWIRNSAKSGHVPARQMLALAYKYGLGVAKNEEEASKWA